MTTRSEARAGPSQGAEREIGNTAESSPLTFYKLWVLCTHNERLAKTTNGSRS